MKEDSLPNNSKAIYNRSFEDQGIYYIDVNRKHGKQNLFILEYKVPDSAKYEVYDETDTAERQYIILGKLDVSSNDDKYIDTVKHIQNVLASMISTTEEVEDYDKYHSQQVEELKGYMEYKPNQNVKLSVTKEMYDNFIKTPLKSDKSIVVDRTLMIPSHIREDKISYSRNRGIYLKNGIEYGDDEDNDRPMPTMFEDTSYWSKVSVQEETKKEEELRNYKGIRSSDKQDFYKFGYKSIGDKLDKLKEIYSNEPDKYKTIAQELVNKCAHEYAVKHKEKEIDDSR